MDAEKRSEGLNGGSRLQILLSLRPSQMQRQTGRDTLHFVAMHTQQFGHAVRLTCMWSVELIRDGFGGETRLALRKNCWMGQIVHSNATLKGDPAKLCGPMFWGFQRCNRDRMAMPSELGQDRRYGRHEGDPRRDQHIQT